MRLGFLSIGLRFLWQQESDPDISRISLHLAILIILKHNRLIRKAKCSENMSADFLSKIQAWLNLVKWLLPAGGV